MRKLVERLKLLGENAVRTRVRSLVAVLIIGWAGAYLWEYTFTLSDQMNTDAKFIAGFVTGSMVATIINFYFGASEEKQKKREGESDVEEI